MRTLSKVAGLFGAAAFVSLLIWSPALAAKEGSAARRSGSMGAVTALALSYDRTYALTAGGGVWAWGDISEKTDGEFADTLSPVPLLGLAGGIRALTAPAGGQHACALNRQGGVLCWGYNANGQVGDGTTKSRYEPTPVSGLSSGATAVAAGFEHVCALMEDGTVKCWGRNNDGQLGDGTTTDRLTPADVQGLTGVTAITAGHRLTCALTEGGGVKCWGGGYLGTSENTPSLTPVDVEGLRGARAISTGELHSCALLADGSVSCWGNYVGGKLGDGSGRHKGYSPLAVQGLAGPVKAIAAGGGHSCALLEDGRVECWGKNDYGQIGDGTNEQRNTAVPVSGLSGASAIGAGNAHTCAVTPSGVKCWGWNGNGQLGDGTRTNRNTPVGIGAAGYRPTGPLVPEITTYIPTPLDISTDIAVIGTNLGLAAIASILFAIGAELITRTLSEHETKLPRFLQPLLDRIRRAQEQVGDLARRIFSRPTIYDALKLAGIMLFYGLVFSLLEKGWNPFTLTGFYLLFSMTIAYGVVGIADDIAQWRAARQWGVPASLTIRPTNILLAIGSTAVSRGFSMVPGLMFGTPEALSLDELALDRKRASRLMKIGTSTLLGIGAGVWLLTIGTGLLQRTTLPEAVGVLLGGLESLLLLVFAVTLENVFVRMLGLPGTMGQALRKWNRLVWAGLLLLVTFAFYHTLINPKGGLASALQESNVRVFSAVALAFAVFAAGIWFYFKRQVNRPGGDGMEPPRPEYAAAVKPEPPADVQQPEAVKPEPPPRPSAVVYRDGDVVKCQHCGKSLRVKTVEKGKIVFSTPESRRGIAWRCQFCGFVTCDACATNPANPMIPVCPSCGKSGGPYYFPPAGAAAKPAPAAPAGRKARSAPTAWIILAGGVLLVGVLAVGLALARSVKLPNLIAGASPTPAPTSTPRPTNPPPTATPEFGWVADFAGPILSFIVGRPPDFEDDFSNPEGHETRWPDVGQSVSFEAGVMRLTTVDGWVGAGGSLNAVDFALQFDFTPVIIPEVGDVGVTWRGTEDNSFYGFVIYPWTGHWSFARVLTGEWQDLQGGSISSMRVGQVMRVLLLVRGEGMAVYLDGRPVAIMTDASTRGDYNNLGVWSKKSTHIVDVDNVKFWNLDNITISQADQPTAGMPESQWVADFADPILSILIGRVPDFEDDFSTPKGHGQRWPDVDKTVTFVEGVMRLTTTDGWVGAGGSMHAVDFAMQFDFTPVVIPNVGSMNITWRGTEDSSFYGFSINPADGYWSFGRMVKGEWQDLEGDYISPLQVGQVMRVLLLVRGGGMAVYLDGRPVGYMTDADIRGDYDNLGVWSDKSTIVVDVDNVKFWNLTGRM